MSDVRDGPRELVLIAAVMRNGVIGNGNDLVFRDPTDQRHFRAATMGCPVIMGRKTWDSLPARFRPLPGRRNVVLSRDANHSFEGAERAADLPSALTMLAEAPKAFVIGGGELYAQALPLATELLLTEVDAAPSGNVFFPAWDRAQFTETARISQTGNGVAFDFVSYIRR